MDVPGEIDEAIAAELRLMDPSVRSSRALSRELLDPDFVEIGASGRRWTYAEMLAALSEIAGGSAEGPRYEPSAMNGTVLAPGLVHLTYDTHIDGHHAHRSSLWRRHTDGTWRMYYHQATPFPK
ncbi:nuclear transport factor 2 family protein [Streptomyces sp. NPDC046324]|uniref:nuclear transport factor 2 family protein n=1 Tax=Streptomyces sp. NPDC046324 TaxID=3154915 RepID=UPI0033FBA540